MKFEQLIVILPCQSLESLTLDRTAEEADQLLSAWTALYHPALLASAGSVPSWFPAENPPQEVSSSLVILPQCCEESLPEGWVSRAETTAARVIRKSQDRPQIVAAALDALGGAPAELNPDLVGDFFALGFCHFQVELLTRQLRYMSNLDAEQFKRRALAAAESVLKGDQQSARDELHGAFDLLTEAREYFYPIQTYLLDLTLTAPTTLGESLRKELAGSGPTNLLISGALVGQLAREEPQTLVLLKEALEKGTVSLVGGEYEEQEVPLLPLEAILDQFQRGLTAYDSHLGRHPTVFGRRRFGLWPALPQVLQKLGFAGAMHFTLDDGRFPTGNQSKIRWEGLDAAVAEALVRVPVNAGQSEGFLTLPKRLGDTMDLDHAATMVFAHWPDHVSPWYGDLRRMAAYSPVLGRFSAVGDYFQATQLVGKLSKHRADDYRCPYLRQAVAAGQPDPVSRWVRYYGRRAAADALQAVGLMADLIGGTCRATSAGQDLLREVEDSRAEQTERPEGLDGRLANSVEEAARRFAASLPRAGAPPEDGCLLLNPFSFARQVLVQTPRLARLPALGGPVRAATESAGQKQVIVDVPAMGFAWVGPGPEEPVQQAVPKAKKKSKEEPPLAAELLLQNEFFQAQISPTTGAIQAIHEYNSRGNRLGQQIALRLAKARASRRDPLEEETSEKDYSIMAADEVSVACAGPLVGEIVSRGRLVDREGQRLAGFRQSTQVRRGSRVIEMRIELDVDRQPEPDPWNSYYAVRFAWGDETAEVYRSVNLASRPTEASLLESPYFLDLRTPKTRTTILTGGLPYHRRFGLRMLDTILVVHGETARSFRLGVGIGLLHPVPAALDFLAPQGAWPETAPPPGSRSGWLFHLDAKNVVATHWSPLLKEGRIAGYRVRLLETEGRGTRVGLRSLHSVKTARKVDYTGAQPTELSIEGDRVTIDLGAHEWAQVEVESVD